MSRGPRPILTDDERAARKRAHAIVTNAIRRGTLVRGQCEKCGPIHAHHRNGYEDTLDVVWLCHSHHAAEHMPAVQALWASRPVGQSLSDERLIEYYNYMIRDFEGRLVEMKAQVAALDKYRRPGNVA